MYVKVIQGEKVLHPPRNYKCKISRKCGQKLPLPLCHYMKIYLLRLFNGQEMDIHWIYNPINRMNGNNFRKQFLWCGEFQHDGISPTSQYLLGLFNWLSVDWYFSSEMNCNILIWWLRNMTNANDPIVNKHLISTFQNACVVIELFIQPACCLIFCKFFDLIEAHLLQLMTHSTVSLNLHLMHFSSS